MQAGPVVGLGNAMKLFIQKQTGFFFVVCFLCCLLPPSGNVVNCEACEAVWLGLFLGDVLVAIVRGGG